MCKNPCEQWRQCQQHRIPALQKFPGQLGKGLSQCYLMVTLMVFLSLPSLHATRKLARCWVHSFPPTDIRWEASIYLRCHQFPWLFLINPAPPTVFPAAPGTLPDTAFHRNPYDRSASGHHSSQEVNSLVIITIMSQSLQLKLTEHLLCARLM